MSKSEPLKFRKGFKRVILEEPIITDNTKEVRDFLKDLGFEIPSNIMSGSYIIVSVHSGFWLCNSLDIKKEDQEKIMINNCIGNTDRFKREIKVKKIIVY